MIDKTLSTAMQLYDQGDFDGLKELVSQAWPDDTTSVPTLSLAEACRYLFILAVRRKDATASNLWRARAMSAAILTGGTDTIAGLVLQPFFILTEIGSHAEARLVLNEMLRLIPETHPRAELFRGRLFHEKLAYSFAKEKRFEEAREPYLEAAKHCNSDPRGALKVRGGAAIAGYLALRCVKHSTLELDAPRYVSEMEGIVVEARKHGFPDVLAAAECNLELMKARKFEGWCPFETE